MEAFLVAVDVLENEVGVLGVPERQPQLVGAAALVDEVLSRLEGPLILSPLDLRIQYNYNSRTTASVCSAAETLITVLVVASRPQQD